MYSQFIFSNLTVSFHVISILNRRSFGYIILPGLLSPSPRYMLPSRTFCRPNVWTSLACEESRANGPSHLRMRDTSAAIATAGGAGAAIPCRARPENRAVLLAAIVCRNIVSGSTGRGAGAATSEAGGALDVDAAVAGGGTFGAAVRVSLSKRDACRPKPKDQPAATARPRTAAMAAPIRRGWRFGPMGGRLPVGRFK